MLRFLLRRLALTIPTFIALMFVTFVAIRLVPGDPVEVRVGERGISPERLAQFRHELGLDQPVWKQFLDYVWQLLHGDFGMSLATNQKVLTESRPISATVGRRPGSRLSPANFSMWMPFGITSSLSRGAPRVVWNDWFSP